MPGETNKTNQWGRKVAIGVAVIAFGGAGAFLFDHLAEAQEKHARGDVQEVEQTEIGKLVEKLGKRAAADDAAEDERAKLCRMGMIDDAQLCGAVGVDLTE